MDARVIATDRPVYVDLDGTLIKTDLLWESLFLLARQSPLSLVNLPRWLAGGKAVLKAELAERIHLDVATLPYREEVLAELQKARGQGRRIVLATGAHEKLAADVARHLGLFDDVMASSREVSLTGGEKLLRIVAEGDLDGFDYYGNSAEDLCLLEAAAEPIVVAPDRKARQWQVLSGAHLFEGEDRDLVRNSLKAMRPHQWMKNLLVFVPLVLDHAILNAGIMMVGLAAFFAFSFAASAVYILNDLLDLQADRLHRTKCKRPFASGAVPIPVGLWLAVGLLALSGALSLMLPPMFQAVLFGYIVMTTLYSFFLKRMLLIDVLTLAGLYTVRIVAGAAAGGVEGSFWLMAFSVFFFLSLALVKRYTELLDFTHDKQRTVNGRGYRAIDLETIGQAGMTSGFASVLVLALYIDSSSIQACTLCLGCSGRSAPWSSYIIVRMWVLARRSQMHDDPVVFLLQDWRSQIMIATGAVMFVMAAYV